MALSILVGHASEHGSTTSIAERIAARLAEHGCQVTVLPASEITDVTAYDAVVLGSAVHDSKWLEPARELVARCGQQLAVRPVWLFSVGMSGALWRPLRALARKAQQRVIADIRPVVLPRDHHVFSGVIRREHVPRTGSVIMRVLGCRFGDYRDWHEADSWAASIAASLTAGRLTRPTGT